MRAPLKSCPFETGLQRNCDWDAAEPPANIYWTIGCLMFIAVHGIPAPVAAGVVLVAAAAAVAAATPSGRGSVFKAGVRQSNLMRPVQTSQGSVSEVVH